MDDFSLFSFVRQISFSSSICGRQSDFHKRGKEEQWIMKLHCVPAGQDLIQEHIDPIENIWCIRN